LGGPGKGSACGAACCQCDGFVALDMKHALKLKASASLQSFISWHAVLCTSASALHHFVPMFLTADCQWSGSASWSRAAHSFHRWQQSTCDAGHNRLPLRPISAKVCCVTLGQCVTEACVRGHDFARSRLRPFLLPFGLKVCILGHGMARKSPFCRLFNSFMRRSIDIR
jgi:hypothetical protein